MKTYEQLRPIQKWGCRRIYNHETTILAWDMGAGKTVVVLTAADDCLYDGIAKRVLIIAPLLVAQATFPDEFAEWDHLREVEWTLIRAEDDDPDVVDAMARFNREARDLGLDAEEARKYAARMKNRFKDWKRRKLASDGCSIHIINKQALNWLWKFHDNGKTWPYDMLIIDEASMFKNAKKRTENKEISQFGVVAKARKKAVRVVQMTGTPAPKGLLNLWGPAYIADLGERLYTSKFQYQTRYFNKHPSGFGWIARPGSFGKIMDKLSDIMFSLAPEDYPPTPGAIDRLWNVTLPKKVLEEYRRFERDLVSETYDVEAVNSGVLAQKLMQFANGSMYRADGSLVAIHDKKMEALEEIVEEADGEPVLIAYNFRFDLNRILKRFKKAEVFGKNGDVRVQKKRWNDGLIPILAAHPASVGHGQNIQFGGNINVWYGLTPDLELYQQWNKRLDRPGQTRKVTNHHIIAKNTYDQDILPILKERKSEQDDILRAVVKRIRRHG